MREKVERMFRVFYYIFAFGVFYTSLASNDETIKAFGTICAIALIFNDVFWFSEEDKDEPIKDSKAGILLNVASIAWYIFIFGVISTAYQIMTGGDLWLALLGFGAATFLVIADLKLVFYDGPPMLFIFPKTCGRILFGGNV